MPWKNTWEIEELKLAVKNSTSFREVLPKLSLKYSGSNATRIKNICKEQNINFSHFIAKKIPCNKKHIDDLLTYQNRSSSNLRKRLIKDGIMSHECSNCNLKEWLGKPIPLELHHIDGVRQNNNLNNLTLLCPNCHALTDNYRGKNMKQTGKTR